MRRLAISLDDIAARDNLALATWKAAQGKRQRPVVARFLEESDARLSILARSILDETAPKGQARQFVIHDPKRRVITAACFEDRVLHHALLNLAEPRFEQALVDSVFACRRGRGVHAAISAVQKGLQRHAWVVQVDVDGYFPSIDHGVLKAQLARRFKGAGVLALMGRIIDAGAASGCGLPIGALTSQHFANGYLDSADRLLLAHAGVAGHVRYMDDIVWFCSSRGAAQDSLAALREHLAHTLSLKLKPGVVLRPCDDGLAFCGARIRQGVVLPSGRKARRYRQAVQRLQQAEASGVEEGLLQRAHDAAAAPLAHLQSQRLRTAQWPGRRAEPESVGWL